MAFIAFAHGTGSHSQNVYLLFFYMTSHFAPA